MERKINYKILLPSLLVPLGLGGLTAFLLKDSFGIYEILYKPLFSPPKWLFGPAWTLLYILMGIACYLVLMSDVSSQRKGRAIKAYAVQLALNILWPYLFFGLEMFGLSMLCAALLLAAVLVCYVLFAHINEVSGRLLLPYIFWCAYALYLNTGVVLLN
ncbi:MAG: tryptophan-rich sensory protein [Oscillospiraceae bacterium]|nr:tryptophan-rich sensory protein [Oscillospiraceae bacterium]